MTLAEFLLARFAEDVQKIEYMSAERRRVETAPIYQSYPANWLAGVDIFVSPARVLAECEAKRRIVELHPADGDSCELCMHWSSDGFDPVTVPWPCDTLKLLALPYADHEAFQDEWRV